MEASDVYTKEQVKAYQGDARVQIGNSMLFDADWGEGSLDE